MSNLHFYKYDGAGNDFVLLDTRDCDPCLSQGQIARLCHRRFGIGADGLMTLGRSGPGFDFEMKYYNSDGALGSMCGNGGRCITAFAHRLGIGDGKKHFRFNAFDGPHEAEVLMWDEHENVGLVCLGMKRVGVDSIKRCLDGWFLDTGSPHYVQRVSGIESFDVFNEGRRLRHNDIFPEGTNVDFIEDMPDGSLYVRTYERGVEDETWACGTGVTACAIVTGNGRIKTKGGDFKVTFTPTGHSYEDVNLTGPVAMNFEGDIRI